MSRLRRLVSPRLAGATSGGLDSFSLVKVLVNGMSAAVAGLILSRLLSGFTQVLIVRTLGPELYGEYALLISNLTLLTSLLGLGIDTWLLHQASREPERLGWFVSQVLWVKFLGSMVLLTYLGIVWSHDKVSALALVIGGVGIMFDGVAQTGYSALRATRRNGQVAAFQVIAPAMLLAALYITPPQSLNATLLISVLTACNVLMAAIMLFWLWRLCRGHLLRSFSLVQVVRSAWLFVTADVLSNISTQVGISILGATVGTAAVGLFSPARDLVLLTFLVPNLIFAVGLPLLNDRKANPAERGTLLWAMSLAAAAYGVAVLAVFWLFGDVITNVLLTSRYRDSLPFLQIMSFVPLVKSGSFVAVAVLITNQRQRLRVVCQFVIMVVAVVGGWLVIPAYGAAGAAWLYVGTEALLFLIYFVAARIVLRQTRV